MITLKSIEIIRLGFRSLHQHAMRSMLTMLGILFGVCSVIAMLAIGEGTSLETQEQFRQLGATNIILASVKPDETEGAANRPFWAPNAYGLTYDDAEVIQSTLPHVEVVIPQRRMSRMVSFRHRRLRATVVGTVPWAANLEEAQVASGRRLSAADEQKARNFCVLGATVAEVLFPYESPLNKAVRVGETYYRVVGVLARRGNPQARGSEQAVDYNREIYIPLRTSRTRFGETLEVREAGTFTREQVELHMMIVKCDQVEDVTGVARAVEEILKRRHRKADWSMNVPLEQIRAVQESGRRFSVMLGAIAAISLLVGGIGIMNIMLASVTERTREIGIRRALGAKKRDITLQFLVETVVISAVGGLLGVVVGILLPQVITQFTGQRTAVTAWSLGLSVFISLGIGLVFGIYPAWRAAQLDPIEALRHE
jgi:putative ABC transport system permease protein